MKVPVYSTAEDTGLWLLILNDISKLLEEKTQILWQMAFSCFSFYFSPYFFSKVVIVGSSIYVLKQLTDNRDVEIKDQNPF